MLCAHSMSQYLRNSPQFTAYYLLGSIRVLLPLCDFSSDNSLVTKISSLLLPGNLAIYHSTTVPSCTALHQSTTAPQFVSSTDTLKDTGSAGSSPHHPATRASTKSHLPCVIFSLSCHLISITFRLVALDDHLGTPQAPTALGGD